VKGSVVSQVVTIQLVELRDVIVGNTPSTPRHAVVRGVLSLGSTAVLLLIIVALLAGAVEKVRQLRLEHCGYY
jgi:hypothetical protein